MDDLCSAKKMRLGGLPGRSFPGTCPASRAGQFLRCGNAAPGTEEAVSASCRRFRRKQKTSSPPRGPAFPEKGGAVPPCRPSPHAVARLRAAPGRERAIKPRTSPAAAAPLPAKARRSRRAGAAEGRKGTQRRSPGQDIAVSAYGRHVAGNGEPASDHDTAFPLPTQRARHAHGGDARTRSPGSGPPKIPAQPASPGAGFNIRMMLP